MARDINPNPPTLTLTPTPPNPGGRISLLVRFDRNGYQERQTGQVPHARQDRVYVGGVKWVEVGKRREGGKAKLDKDLENGEISNGRSTDLSPFQPLDLFPFPIQNRNPQSRNPMLDRSL